MALWGKTDALASTPKYVARKASFNAATAVDTTNNQINILASGTGFATGDAVVYDRGAGTAITNLTSGSTYYVRVDGAGLISLYDTYAHAIDTAHSTGLKDLAGSPTGTQSLQRTGAANVYGDHVYGGKGIIFVDAQEAQVVANKAKGITGAGWWVIRTYTDAQSATRYKSELLVAMSASATEAGDAEDTFAADLTITIGTQPASIEVTSGDDTTLTVVATTNGDEVLTYQWYDASDDSAVTGATSASLALTNITAPASYYVIVSGGGISTTSNTAAITIAA